VLIHSQRSRDKSPSNKRTTTGCSCSSTGGSVIKPLQHLAHQEGGLLVFGSCHHSWFPASSPWWTSTLWRHDATTVMLESQPQRTMGTTTSPPTATGIDVALLAACQLLNNPPPSEASPSAAKQWHHDVDQLVITAINMPCRERRHQPSTQLSRISSVSRTPSVAQAPPVLPNARPPVQHHAPIASYMMTDLREEINRYHGGENSYTAIERHRERR
jgi:hypothetical protein